MDAPTLPWIIALVSVALLAAGLTLWLIGHRTPRNPTPIPEDWPLTSRPVFTADERRVFRELRDALPHHVILSKLPLVRFCQPDDPQETRYWYELLGSIHVNFAVCSPNGRVLAAVDLDTERAVSPRTLQIKHAVLEACRVRYLRCRPDQLPSAPELQLLLPQAAHAYRAPHPAPLPPDWTGRDAGDDEPGFRGLRSRRSTERAVLWQESSIFQDSFFAPDTRSDTGPGALDEQPATAPTRHG